MSNPWDFSNMNFEKMNENIEKQARERIEKGEDTGHLRLISALEALCEDAKAFQYHDYLNTKLAMPKLALTVTLEDLIDKVKNGDFDN